ncbi:MAG: hypothetical protein ABL933_00970 [Methyloglobulus sp.]|nr:hypothetical protein [Methyloglobulus sp.]
MRFLPLVEMTTFILNLTALDMLPHHSHFADAPFLNHVETLRTGQHAPPG